MANDGLNGILKENYAKGFEGSIWVFKQSGVNILCAITRSDGVVFKTARNNFSFVVLFVFYLLCVYVVSNFSSGLAIFMIVIGLVFMFTPLRFFIELLSLKADDTI